MSTPQTEANKDGASSGLALATGSAVCAFCREPAGHTLGECPASLDREEAVAGYLAARKLLRRCLPIIAADAQMVADITRFAPLDPASQAAHDLTEYESEKLMREIPAMLSPNTSAISHATATASRRRSKTLYDH